jgi:hypothetical protein
MLLSSGAAEASAVWAVSMVQALAVPSAPRVAVVVSKPLRAVRRFRFLILLE